MAQFDFSSDPNGPTPGAPASQNSEARPFLGIRFECCRTYGRIYRNEEQTKYVGRCPKCLARIEVPIGSGGTSSRFFNAG